MNIQLGLNCPRICVFGISMNKLENTEVLLFLSNSLADYAKFPISIRLLAICHVPDQGFVFLVTSLVPKMICYWFPTCLVLPYSTWVMSWIK